MLLAIRPRPISWPLPSRLRQRPRPILPASDLVFFTGRGGAVLAPAEGVDAVLGAEDPAGIITASNNGGGVLPNLTQSRQRWHECFSGCRHNFFTVAAIAYS